jgi:hypothetical protein
LNVKEAIGFLLLAIGPTANGQWPIANSHNIIDEYCLLPKALCPSKKTYALKHCIFSKIFPEKIFFRPPIHNCKTRHTFTSNSATATKFG